MIDLVSAALLPSAAASAGMGAQRLDDVVSVGAEGAAEFSMTVGGVG